MARTLHRPDSIRVSTCLAALGFLFLPFFPGALAQELRINQISLQGPNNVLIQYDAQANSTYLLLQGNSVNTITTPVATNSGPAGRAQFIQTIPAANRESYFRIQLSGPPRPVVLDPASGASEVGVTVRPKATFPKPIVISSLNANNFFASFAGNKLAATIVPANDGTFAWLFFDPPMPSASQIAVTVDGSSIRTQNGSFLDADADGKPGGLVTFNFSTVSVVPVPGTVVTSRIVDPGPDLIPRTADDVTMGGNGFNYLLPIQGVKVFVLGMENNVAYTDASGSFTLTNMPVGDVKVVLDGRTATNPRAGYYFPEMVMDTTFSPGITNGVMPIRDINGVVVRDANGVPIQALAMYLPRVASNVLQTVSASVTRTITLQSNAAYNLPPKQQQYLSLEIMPNSLIGMDGQPLATGQVGVSVVPPELVRDMLPPGLLQHTFDITVQAPGIATFATPAPMTFPNVFSAPPGTKLNFLSFDHTTGRLVIEGTATVSTDGLSVHTDPGTGITHPGWHGLTPPGDDGHGGGGGPKDKDPDPKPKKNCDTERNLAISAGVQCLAAIASAIPKVLPGVGCAISLGLSAVGATADCKIDPSGCGKSIGFSGVGGLLGCIPVIGGALGASWTCGLGAGTALLGYQGCVEVYGSSLALLAAPQIPKNIFFEQQALWAAAADVYAIVLGNPKWTVIDPRDLLKTQAIFQALQDSIQPSSPGGERIIQSERAAILQLPLPGNLSAADTGALLDRFDQLMSGQTPAGGLDLNALASAGSNLVQVATTLKSRDWVTTYDAYLRGIDELVAAQDKALDSKTVASIPLVRAGLRAASTQRDSASLLVPGAFYKLTDLSDGFVQRGRLPASGKFEQLFLAADAFYTIHYVDPVSARVAVTAFHTGPSGSSFTIPRAIFVEASSPDTDGDGMSDEAEEILGTDPRKFSTCGDGISDLAKVRQGLDLANCLPPPTGIIASLPLPGEAKEVVLAGSPSNASELTAYLACGSRGLSIVNATKFQSPILLGQLDLSGDAVDVAVDSKLKIAVVAAVGSGLHLVDVSDPLQPKLLRRINNPAVQQVEAVDGIAYAAAGTAIISYDIQTGGRLQTLDLSAENLTGLAREGLFLYTMDSLKTLRAIDISGPVMVARGSVNMPNGGGKLFVGNAIAYVAAGNVSNGGFATANVSNPDGLTVLSGVDNNGLAGTTVTANGSGLAVGVGFSHLAMFVFKALDVLNVSDPSNTGAFLARFDLPVDPFSVAIGAGIAFVADGTAGLQVVTYLPFDNKGVAPVVSISTSSTNVLEGSFVPIRVQVSDDVQVRSVELLVNGQVVLNDVSFPFDLVAAMPLLAAGSTHVVLQARATDTGGNVGLSNPIAIQLMSDTTPPTITRIAPPNNSIQNPGFRAVTIDFSEPLDETTVTAQSVQLLGGNGAVAPQNIQFRFQGAEVQFTYPELTGGDYQVVIHGAAMKDRAGNALSSTNVVRGFTINALTAAQWINPAGGFWDNPTNWASGVLPGPTDHVVIAVPGNVTVTIRQGTNTIHSLVSSNAVTMTGGTLAVASTIQVDNTFTLTGGTLDGVTLNTDATVAGPVKVINGLTLNAALMVGKPNGGVTLTFLGTQTLGGTGEVVFAGCCRNDIYAQAIGSPLVAATLTIGPGMTIHGSGVGNIANFVAFDSVINLGTISADAADASITFAVDGGFSTAMNQGTLRALNGGSLNTRNLDNTGIVEIGNGSTLTLGLSWNNSGTLTLNGGTVNLGGNFTRADLGMFNRTGGTVNLTGTFSGGLTLDAATGSWNLQGGTIKGGTITTSGGAELLISLSGGKLDGVTLASGVTVDGVRSLTIVNGLTLSGGATITLTGGNSYLFANGTQTIGGNGQIVFTGISSGNNLFVGGGNSGASTLTLGTNVTVRGLGSILEAGAPGTLVNQGTIQADVSGQTLSVSLNSFTNTGTVQAIGGGLLAIQSAMVNSGTLTPGNPPKVLNVSGTYTQLVAGVLNIHIGGTNSVTDYSQLKSTGGVGLNGTLNLTLINGYQPNLGDTFPIMTYASATGRFAVVNGLSIGNGKRFDLTYGATGLTLTVVPSP